MSLRLGLTNRCKPTSNRLPFEAFLSFHCLVAYLALLTPNGLLRPSIPEAMTGRGIGQAISLVIFPIDFPDHVTYLTRRAIRMRELEKPPK